MQRSIIARALLLLVGAAVVVAGSASARQGCPAVAPSAAISLAVTPRADNALIADATVTLKEAAPVFIEYGNDQAGWLRTPTSDAATSVQRPIVRMRAETAYQVRAFSLNEAGCPSAVATADVTTGQLPQILRLYTVQSTGQPSMPLYLMDWPSLAAFLPPGAPGDRSRYQIGVDATGQVVWYYTVPAEYPPPPRDAAAFPMKQRADGTILYPAVYWSVEDITPDGQIVRHFRTESGAASRPHHDVTELQDGRIAYLGAEDREIDDTRNGGPPNLLVRGDTLQVVDLNTNAVEQVWSAFDTLDPTTRERVWDEVKIDNAVDWTHANAVSVGPRGNVLISIRHLSQIISLSPDLKTIEWKLGGPDSTFALADPNEVFKGQHGVVEPTDNHILMFDNGNFKPEPYSRAVEFEIDPVTKTARKVWEYRPQPDIFAAQLSSVVRLPNGNTLVNIGWRDAPNEPGVLTEVRPDGTVVWNQEMTYRGMRAIRYRATPITSLAGEQPVEPTAVNLP